jgi:hypothetical protein
MKKNKILLTSILLGAVPSIGYIGHEIIESRVAPRAVPTQIKIDKINAISKSEGGNIGSSMYFSTKVTGIVEVELVNSSDTVIDRTIAEYGSDSNNKYLFRQIKRF